MHHSNVGDYRRSLADSASEPTADRKVITKHGAETAMDTGKIGKGKKDGAITGGATAGKATKGKAAALPPPTEAEENSHEAYGDATLEKELADSRLEVEALQKQIAAAEADDPKAEAMKRQRISEVATRRQNELMDTVHRREQELQRQAKIIARICRAVGEEDPTKVAATVEMFARSLKVAA